MKRARAADRLGVLGVVLAAALPASVLFGYDTFGDGYGSKWHGRSSRFAPASA